MAHLLISFCKVALKPQMTLEQANRGYKFENIIKEAINPDEIIDRYHRLWRVSKPLIKDGYLVGKLGFMSSTSETRTYYDDTRKDFIEKSVDLRQGHYVQWAIDLNSQIMGFEIKLPDIRYQSVIGAFKDILDKRPDIGLTIEHIVESSQFYEWANKLDRVTKFAANLRRPNPDYSSRTKIIEELLELTNGDYAKVEISKEKGSDDSLDTEKTIRDLVDYGEQGYSTIVASGQKKGKSKHFDSRRRMPFEKIDTPELLGVDKVWEQIISELRKFRK